MFRRSARLVQRTLQDHVTSLSLHMSVPTLSVQLFQDTYLKQFYITAGKERATIDYDEIDDHTIHLMHTNVPKEMQGKGIGKILARETFDYCISRNLKIKVSCHFLSKFYEENIEQYQSKVLT